MAMWVSRHGGLSTGLFLVSDSPNRVVAVLEYPDNWSPEFQRLWIDSPDFWIKFNMRDQFDRVDTTRVFEFKGKIFVKLGEAEGLTKIRCLDNLHNDSRDRIPTQTGGEEDEDHSEVEERAA